MINGGPKVEDYNWYQTLGEGAFGTVKLAVKKNDEE